jgi:hypothetical protein
MCSFQSFLSDSDQLSLETSARELSHDGSPGLFYVKLLYALLALQWFEHTLDFENHSPKGRKPVWWYTPVIPALGRLRQNNHPHSETLY